MLAVTERFYDGPGISIVSVIAFHEKAGRSQVDSLLLDKVFVSLPGRVATVATLPSALFDEQFLQNRLAYSQEWNDFVECSQRDPAMDAYRQRCYNLDPLVNRPDPVDEEAIAELRGVLDELRAAQ